MGMRNLVVYTHTDYSDVWPPLLKSINRFLSGFNVYFLINKEVDNLPSEYHQITYSEKNSYTLRLNEAINKLPIENFIFMHEDMFLYEYPVMNLIDSYFNHISEGTIKTIKLIPVGNNLLPCPIDKTLFVSEFSKFSIQPTVISKTYFLEILKGVGSKNIWEFEDSIKFSGQQYISKIGGEKKIGIFHSESLVFPYIATAIVKGKWNISEYPILEDILKENKIDKNIRGFV